jgi:hypothetical protein
MELIKKQRKSVAWLIVTVFLLTSVFGSLGLLTFGSRGLKGTSADAAAASEFEFDTPDYLADNFGLEEGHVFDLVAFGRMSRLMREDGYHLIVLSSPLHEGHSNAMQAIDKAARAAGVKNIYNFDVYMTGAYGIAELGYSNITETRGYRLANYNVNVAANNEEDVAGNWHHGTNGLGTAAAGIPRLNGLLPASSGAGGANPLVPASPLGWTSKDVILLMYNRMGTEGATGLSVANAAQAIVGHVVISNADAEAATTQILFDGLVASVETMLSTTRTTINAARDNPTFIYGSAPVIDPVTLVEQYPNGESNFCNWSFYRQWSHASGTGEAIIVGQRPIAAKHKEDFRLVNTSFAKLLWLHDQPGTRYFAQNASW